MKVGLRIPMYGWRATPEHIATHARTAEDAGFDSLWAADHVVFPREHRTPYPYQFKTAEAMLEPLTALTYVAAVTRRVELGTQVLVLAMRQPVLHAKILASLDHLAGGRLILGAGIGWCREEFEVLSMPFARRGKRMDEHLELLRRFWTQDWVDFAGDFYTVDGWTSRPQPPRHVPIWIGGAGDNNFHRIAKWGDGWLARGRDLPELRDGIARLREIVASHGRDPDSITIAVSGTDHNIYEDRMEQAAELLHTIKALGVHHAIATVDLRQTDRAPHIIERFAARYLPELQRE